MKKLLSILLVVFSICLLSLFAIGCFSKPHNDKPIAHTHSFVDGVCTSCGDKQGTDGLKFTKLDDGNYSVSAGNAKNATAIIVPRTHEGALVTAIAKEGFKDCKTMTTIDLPSSITNMGAYAFRNCNALTHLPLPFWV